MRFLKIKYAILIAAMLTLFFNISAVADERPLFDDSSIIVVTKPQSTGISLYGIQSVSGDTAQSIYDKLGITEITTLAALPSANVNTGGISLFSVSQKSGKQVLKLTLPESGEDKVLEACELLNESDAVEYAQPNYRYYIDSVPDDKKYLDSESNRYHLEKVGAQYVWDMRIDCSAVKVAILDSGLFADHEDLADNLWTNTGEIPNDGIDNDGNGYVDDVHGWDFTTMTSQSKGDNDPEDAYDASKTTLQGHGTHVAGIVSAVTNNGKGVASLARNAKIVPLRIFDADGNSNSAIIIAAIEYINANNAKGNTIDIANCSFGATTYNDSSNRTGDKAVKEAFESCTKTLFTASAGNGNSSGVGQSNDRKTNYSPIYPATYGFDNIISVAASDSNDKLASFSNYGNKVDIAAPGVAILSTINTNLATDSYAYLNGTSQAAPLVASAAAVLKARYPDLSPAEIKTLILDSADQISTLTYVSVTSTRRINSNRRLNAQAIIELADSILDLTPQPTMTPEPTPEPTEAPTLEPTSEPTEEPLPAPPEEPTANPDEEPTTEPAETSTPAPSEEPTAEPTKKPSGGGIPVIPKPTPEVTRLERDSEDSGIFRLIYVPDWSDSDGEIPIPSEVTVYAAYRKNGELMRVEEIELLGDYTSVFSMASGFEDCDIEVYIWKDMLPLHNSSVKPSQE